MESKKVTVYVTLKPTLLDAQGRTVEGRSATPAMRRWPNVRIGKIIEMEVSGVTTSRCAPAPGPCARSCSPTR